MKNKIEFFVYKKGITVSDSALPIMGHFSTKKDEGDLIEASLIIKLKDDNTPEKFDLLDIKEMDEEIISNIIGDYGDSPIKEAYDQLGFKDLITIQKGYSYKTFQGENKTFHCGIKAIKVSSCIQGEYSYLFFGMVSRDNILAENNPMVVFYNNGDEFKSNSITKHTYGNNIYDALIDEPCFGFGEKLVINQKITEKNNIAIRNLKDNFIKKHVFFDKNNNTISLVNIPTSKKELLDFKIIGKTFSFIYCYGEKIEINDFLNYYVIGKEKYGLFNEQYKGWLKEKEIKEEIKLRVSLIKELDLA